MKKIKKISAGWQNDCQGFTLVEVMATLVVFSLIALEVGGIFIQIMSLERRAFASQKIQENSMSVLESIAREIRVSQITDPESLDCSRTNLNISHPISGPISYSLSNGVVQKTISDNGQLVTIPLNSSDVEFTKFNFCVKGSLVSDNQQARVTIIATIKNKTGAEKAEYNLQTTISSRDMLIEFQN